MANFEHLDILKSSANVWNNWRKENKKVSIDLNDANLKSLDLRFYDLSYINLSNTNFSSTDLRFSDLQNANLQNAKLTLSDLRSTILKEADLTGAIFGYTTIGFTDLYNCIGLDRTEHEGPSIIDIRTTSLNLNNIPTKFLSGCGLKKWEIEAIKLHATNIEEKQISGIIQNINQLRRNSPSQLASIFISYSRKDEVFVEKLEAIFEQKDIRCWRDVRHATAGPLEKQIIKAMNISPTVLLVLSENSVNSDWVEFEARKARELEKELDRYVICPIALDDSWKSSNWPERLRYQIEEYKILDFSNWKDNTSFQNEFNKLFKGIDTYYHH